MHYIPRGKGLFTPSFNGQSHEVIFTLRSYDMNEHVGRHEVFIEAIDLHTNVLAIQYSTAIFSHALSSAVQSTMTGPGLNSCNTMVLAWSSSNTW